MSWVHFLRSVQAELKALWRGVDSCLQQVQRRVSLATRLRICYAAGPSVQNTGLALSHLHYFASAVRRVCGAAFPCVPARRLLSGYPLPLAQSATHLGTARVRQRLSRVPTKVSFSRLKAAVAAAVYRRQ